MGERAGAGPEEVTGGGQGRPSHPGAEVLDGPRGGHETARTTADAQGRRGCAAGPTVLHGRDGPRLRRAGAGAVATGPGRLDCTPSSPGNKLPPRGAPSTAPTVL